MTDRSTASMVQSPAPEATQLGGGPEDKREKPSSLGRDAWLELRRRPLFIISSVIILFVLVLAAFPQLFSSVDPGHQDLDLRFREPGGAALFGNDLLGRDIWARVVYGARASIVVGVVSTVGTVLLGAIVGVISGYFGGWLDSLLSRLGEVFVGLPFILGAIVILTTFNTNDSVSETRLILQVVLTITLLVWPVSMRIMRAAVISAKQHDYVQAARGLGASTFRIITKHILPNAVAPVLVYATIALGAFIGLEATLAYLGVGLRSPTVSWGVMLAESSTYVQTAPHMLLFPAGFVTITVLAFVMLGDAVRDALDPKSR